MREESGPDPLRLTAETSNYRPLLSRDGPALELLNLENFASGGKHKSSPPPALYILYYLCMFNEISSEGVGLRLRHVA